MSDKLMYQDPMYTNFVRPPCAQQSQNMQHYSSYPMPPMQTHCDLMYIPQTNRNQATYTPSSYLSCPEQLDTVNWVPDSRAVADIERGLRCSDKMETIEITSKDLSPASCCSNLDLLIPDFYKNKETNLYSKDQWYCNINCSQNYPSCAQMTSNFEEKQKYYCSQKGTETCYYNNYQYIQKSSENFDNFYCYDNKTIETQLFDVNQEQFYNQAPLNEPLSFTDINNVEQTCSATAEGSNDESDIIVEESDEDVTDYSEDLERRYTYVTNCVVCNVMYTPLGSQFYILTGETPLTMSSQQPVFKKLTEMVGELDNKRTYLCSLCLSLINTIDHLQLKLENSKFEFYGKYEKTCKENNVTFKVPSKNEIKNTRSKRKFKNFCGLHSFKCKLCKKAFSIKKLYSNHILSHKLKNRFLCEFCGKRFTKFSKFKTHFHSHSIKKTLKGYTCPLCNKLFRTRSNLKEHENFCSGSLPFQCKHCDKKFPTVTKLKSHTKLKHDKKFVAICSICNVGFVKMSDYKSHKTSHSPEKKFHCKSCDKSYKTMSNLNNHMKFHSDKLPFLCTICNKGFMRKEYLEAHVNNHNGVKNFNCNFCKKKFVSQKNLDAHMKYHEGNVKKKVCTICNKTLTSGFEEHLRTHSNLKEFECDVCCMKFNTKGALAKHMKRKHCGNES